MKIKDRIEALFLASNRSLSLEDIHELLNINSKEDESEVINVKFSTIHGTQNFLTFRQERSPSGEHLVVGYDTR